MLKYKNDIWFVFQQDFNWSTDLISSSNCLRSVTESPSAVRVSKAIMLCIRGWNDIHYFNNPLKEEKVLSLQVFRRSGLLCLLGAREVALGCDPGNKWQRTYPLFPSLKPSPIRVSTSTHFPSENGYEQAKITSLPSAPNPLQSKKKKENHGSKTQYGCQNKIIRPTQTLIKATKHSSGIVSGAMF